jgi:hypothetical protein
MSLWDYRSKEIFLPTGVDEGYQDYALLELEEDIGDITAYIEIRKHIPEEIDNIECSLYGYPGYVYNQDEKNDYLYGMNGFI